MDTQTPVLLLVTAAELARLAGVHPQQVARYIQLGFLSCAARTPSGITLFLPALVQRVKFLALFPSLRGLCRITPPLQHENKDTPH
jgi:hypothetical protein